MLGTKNLFTRLSQLSDIRSVAIANDQSCSISGEGVVQVSTQLSLEKILYVPDFLLTFFPLVPSPNDYFVM